MSDRPHLLELRGLSLRFDGQSLFSDLSVYVSEGDRIVLGGSSGAGKSTLMRCLVDLEARAQSEILWCGASIEAGDLPRFRRQAIYVAQEPARIYASPVESFRACFEYQSASDSRYDPAPAKELAEALRLPAECLDRPIADLSGGEAKRVAIIRALLLQPRLLILDEAAASLDSEARDALATLLAARRELSLVMASHDSEWCLPLCNKRWHLSADSDGSDRTLQIEPIGAPLSPQGAKGTEPAAPATGDRERGQP